MRIPDWEEHKHNARFVLAKWERERRNRPEVLVVHPDFGSVVVRAVGNYDAVCEAARVWGVDELQVFHAQVLAIEKGER